MVIYPPNPIPTVSNSVFLAGSIEQDKAINWQGYIENILDNKGIVILNPRRKEWDNTWKEEISNPIFYEQVNWELDAQEKAALIVMYFDPNTKSPISLLELGLFAKTGKMVVCCPTGFWKKGNVDIVCKRYLITQVKDIDSLAAFILRKFYA
jgi:hypothetical protein